MGIKRALLIGLALALAASAQYEPPAYPSPIAGMPSGWFDLGAWGDSLTAGTGGTAWPTQYNTQYGTLIFQGGVGGQTSTQIAARFLADSTHQKWQTVIWSGRNNYSAQSTILADIASMVAVLPTPKNFLVLSILNSNVSSEWSGGSNYLLITGDNAALNAAQPANYLDIRSYLVSQFNAGNAEDVIDHGHDMVPSTLRSQTVETGSLNGAIVSTSSCAIPLTNTGASLVIPGNTLLVDTEKIYVSTTDGSGNVTGCTRGYASTVAATHLNAAVFTATDPIHLNTAGYLIVAQQVNAWFVAHVPNYVPGTTDISNFFLNPPPVGTLLPFATGSTTLGTSTQPYHALYAISQCGVTGSLSTSACWFLSGDGSTFQFVGKISPNTDNTYDLGGGVASNRFRNQWLSGYIQTGLINAYAVGSLASATTIAPTAPITHVTGTTNPISTITPPAQCSTSGNGCCVRLIPDGLWVTGTAGNIALGTTAVVGKALEECYDNATSKWYPSY